MLKHGEINPLNVHGLRRLTWCPPHFTKVSFAPYISEKDISDWIYENLSERFYLAYEDVRYQDKIDRVMVCGFESGAEASYFGLWLPSINVNYAMF